MHYVFQIVSLGETGSGRWRTSSHYLPIILFSAHTRSLRSQQAGLVAAEVTEGAQQWVRLRAGSQYDIPLESV